MTPAGRAAFARRNEAKTGVYAYEQADEGMLDAGSERLFRANKKAWDHFLSRAPYYRKATIRWVMSAKKDDTRRRRLATLIACEAKGGPIPMMARGKGSAKK